MATCAHLTLSVCSQRFLWAPFFGWSGRASSRLPQRLLKKSVFGEEKVRAAALPFSYDRTDDGVDAETSLSLSLSSCLSLSLYTFFSRSQSVIIFSLKMCVSSKELFSTLKNYDWDKKGTL